MSFLCGPLLGEFLDAFQAFHFDFDLWITTDVEEKKQAIEEILSNRAQDATVVVTGNIDDELPMLLLKEQLSTMIIWAISYQEIERKQISGRWILAERIDWYVS